MEMDDDDDDDDKAPRAVPANSGHVATVTSRVSWGGERGKEQSAHLRFGL